MSNRGARSEPLIAFVAWLLAQRDRAWTINELFAARNVSRATIHRHVRVAERYFPQWIRVEEVWRPGIVTKEMRIHVRAPK